MALKYVVKKTVFGFDQTRTEKCVARPLLAGTVNYPELYEQAAKRCMGVSNSVIRMVIDDLIKVLEWNLLNHMSVKLDDFGTFRPGLGCKPQSEEKDVNADVLCRRKIIFTTSGNFKRILDNASVRKSEKR